MFYNRDLRGNLCRNPDGDDAPWCFTTDPAVRWEHCNLKRCSVRPSQVSSPRSHIASIAIQTPPEKGESPLSVTCCASLPVCLTYHSLPLFRCGCFRLQDRKWSDIPRSNLCYCEWCDVPGVEFSDSSQSHQLHPRDSPHQGSGRQCKCVGVAIKTLCGKNRISF